MTPTTEKLLKRLLDAEKLEHCNECGICTAACPVAKLVPKHHNPRILLKKVYYDLERALSEVGPWLCAWCDRCRERCPQGLNLPMIFFLTRNLAVERGYIDRFGDALNLIGRETPLAEVCALTSFHRVDVPLTMTSLKHLITKHQFKEKVGKTASASIKHRREKVAIVGSGPTGLTAAYELARRGYSITIFESLPVPGGMLRVGIPKYRLPKKVVNKAVRYIESLGVRVKTNTCVGKDLMVDQLLGRGYRAVLIAIGAQRSVGLGIEGEDLKGFTYALDFLRDANMGKKVKVGDRVGVIGGGNVAIDVARAVLRLGSKEIHILYRRSKDDMSANPWEVKEAEREGVKFHFFVVPQKLLGKDGRLVAVECVKTKLGLPDETGRRCLIIVKGSEFTWKFDTVILAIGQTPDTTLLPESIETTDRRTLAVDPITWQTRLPQVFAGGDVVSGPATVIEAIVAGREVAASMDHYLRIRATGKKRVKIRR